ncbi:MAG: glycosyltransferase family 2 protein [Flavobacterium sp.]
MNNQLLISVIIPVYNAEKFLHKCLNSVLKQTYENFELILVNDGSKDNSLQICQEWSLKDSRVKTIDQKNQGPGAARNTGLVAANGDYICFLDSDDFIEDDLLATAIKSIEEFKYDMIIFGFNKLTIDGKRISTIKHKEADLRNVQQQQENLAELFLDGGCFAVWDKLFRKEFLIQNNIVFDLKKRGEDLAFMIKSYKCATSLKAISNILHNYHVVYNASHKYDKFIIENHTENYASLFELLSNKDANKSIHTNSNKYLKRTFVLWFGIVVPMNIVSNKDLSIGQKRTYLQSLYYQDQFTIWLKYLNNITVSKKDETIFKVVKTKNISIIILFIKTLTSLRRKLNLTF